jgi:hypothetical protein
LVVLEEELVGIIQEGEQLVLQDKVKRELPEMLLIIVVVVVEPELRLSRAPEGMVEPDYKIAI